MGNRRGLHIIYTDKDWLLDQGTPAWGAEIEHSMGDLVREAIDALPERHREVVQLRISTGWTFKRIAAEVGMPTRGYAFMYWKRGLKKVQDYIESVADVPADWKEDT